MTKKAYENCTHIYGNLILKDLVPPKVVSSEKLELEENLDYLSSIEEVYGYVYISNVSVKTLNLRNL